MFFLFTPVYPRRSIIKFKTFDHDFAFSMTFIVLFGRMFGCFRSFSLISPTRTQSIPYQSSSHKKFHVRQSQSRFVGQSVVYVHWTNLGSHFLFWVCFFTHPGGSTSYIFLCVSIPSVTWWHLMECPPLIFKRFLTHHSFGVTRDTPPDLSFSSLTIRFYFTPRIKSVKKTKRFTTPLLING